MSAILKQGAAGITGCLAVIISAAGIITTMICSMMNSAYALSALPAIFVLELLGAVLTVVGIALGGRQDAKKSYGIFPVLAAIVAFMFAIGKLINERILLISGLFTYNSQNAAGWQVFYATAAAVICLLLAVILLIVSSFAAPKE